MTPQTGSSAEGRLAILHFAGILPYSYVEVVDMLNEVLLLDVRLAAVFKGAYEGPLAGMGPFVSGKAARFVECLVAAGMRAEKSFRLRL